MVQDSDQVYRYMLQKAAQMKEIVRLRQLQNVVIPDILLLPCAPVRDPVVIYRFHSFVFTKQGETHWKDILGARVAELECSAQGLEVRLEGADPHRVLALSRLLAGEGNLKEFDRWVFVFST